MSSEARRTTENPDVAAFRGIGAPPAGHSAWQSVERKVLLTKLEDLEQRARRLEYLETRLRDLSREVQLLNRLTEATHAINSATGLPQLFETALEQCLEILQAEDGSILLYSSETHELILAKGRGSHPNGLEGSAIPLGQGVAGYVALHREPLGIADIEKDGRFPARNSGRYATGSFLCLPVLCGEKLLAILSVADRRDRAPFTADDLRTATLVAKDLASAIERVRQLEASQDMHRQFVSKLAHELRNPLDGVLRFINLTLADQSPEERKRRYLLASKQGLERLTGIVKSLTGFYRYARPSEEMVSVNDLIRQACELQEGKAEQRSVRVTLDLQEDLPALRGGAGLFQVFTNLVSNAYDAMQEQGGTFSVSSRLADDMLVLRFSDTGCGMTPDVLGRIFAPFFTTKEPGKGMGLGLAVCQEIVSRLRGQIAVTSEPGHGTTFVVTLPCTKVAEPVEI